MINKKSGKTIAIFSIVYGAINALSSLSENEYLELESSIDGVILSIGLIVIGIISLIKINKNVVAKGLVITMLVFWFLLIFISLIFLMIPIFGPIFFIVSAGISITPIITGFKYLSSLKQPQVFYSNSFTTDQGQTLSSKLDNLKDLFEKGYLTEEEYNEAKKKVIDENI